MDDWTQVPGARVVGHDARVVGRGATGWSATCTCGYAAPDLRDYANAALALVSRQQAAVRTGATVSGGDDDGLAGVREPRRPRPPLGHLSVTRYIA